MQAAFTRPFAQDDKGGTVATSKHHVSSALNRLPLHTYLFEPVQIYSSHSPI